MVTYFGIEHASSKDPHDWGRAMAVALNRLLEAAQVDRDYLEHKHLLDQDIMMRATADGDGVTVHLSWRPQNQEDAPADEEETAEEVVEGSGRGG